MNSSVLQWTSAVSPAVEALLAEAAARGEGNLGDQAIPFVRASGV